MDKTVTRIISKIIDGKMGTFVPQRERERERKGERGRERERERERGSFHFLFF